MGPAGVGKSALVAALAREVGAAGREVVWVALSDATRVELARVAVREALGVPADLPDGAPLSAALRDRGPALLVVDGVDAVAHTLGPELDALARGLAEQGLVVVTSGVRLHVPDEDVMPLGGLGEEDGARLLARYAGAVDEAAARRVSAALEGFPLALVLAGVRAAALGVEAVAARLDDAMGILAAPLAGAPPRHHSVRAALEVAWTLLGTREREALAACAAFAGAFDVAAAEAVIGPGRDADALSALGLLVDGSWLSVTDGESGRSFRAHPLIRAFSIEREPEAAAAGRSRHAELFAARAEGAWRGAERGAMGRWRSEVRRDAEDLWRVASDAEEPARRVHAALALGLIAEDRDTEAQLACASAGLSAGAEGGQAARLLELRARGYRGQGRLADAVADLDRAVAVAGDSEVLPLVLAQRSVVRMHLDDASGAASDARAALEAVSSETPAFVRLVARATTAFLDYRAGALDRAEPALERALGEALAADAGTHAAELAGILGNLAHLSGRLDAARDRLAAAARSAEGEGALRLAAIFDGYVALVDHEDGRHDAAMAGYDATIERLERFASRRHEALFKAARSALCASLGREPERARRDLAVATHLADELGSPTLHEAIAALREVVRARWDGAPNPRLTPGFTGDDDVVVARRIAAAALATLGAAPVLAISADGARVRAEPDGEVIDLARRAPLRRVLAALVAAHAAEPGRVLDADALREAGWPGERMLEDAGRQRVRVAVWTLRKLGLKALIETEGGAYRLIPTVVLGALREV